MYTYVIEFNKIIIKLFVKTRFTYMSYLYKLVELFLSQIDLFQLPVVLSR